MINGMGLTDPHSHQDTMADAARRSVHSCMNDERLALICTNQIDSLSKDDSTKENPAVVPDSLVDGCPDLRWLQPCAKPCGE